jgi:hypothetical protein
MVAHWLCVMCLPLPALLPLLLLLLLLSIHSHT